MNPLTTDRQLLSEEQLAEIDQELKELVDIPGESLVSEIADRKEI